MELRLDWLDGVGVDGWRAAELVGRKEEEASGVLATEILLGDIICLGR